MNLKICLPNRVFADAQDIAQVVVETRRGCFGLLPHRLDCIAVLVPGILSYTRSLGGTVYVAVDEGTLVKVGPEVRVCVRRAIAGSDLAALQGAVKKSFREVDEKERLAQILIAKLESSLFGRISEFPHER